MESIRFRTLPAAVYFPTADSWNGHATERRGNDMENRRKCAVCGVEFALNPKGQTKVYCSPKCRKSAFRDRHTITVQAHTGDGTNAAALKQMLDAYIIPDSLAAVAQAARCLAAAVDAEPRNSGLWARYQAALAALVPLVAGVEDSELAAVLAEIRAFSPPQLPAVDWEREMEHLPRD